MIYYHADDYGINIEQSERILSCRKEGCLNSVSIMPTSDCLDDTVPMLDNGCKKAVHINISDGKAILSREKIPLLVDDKGFFNRSFLQLLLISVVSGRKLELQVARESYAQICKILEYMPGDYKLRLDSHRHYHMIPCVLRGICRAAEKTEKEIEYIRLPMESAGLYLGEPRLWSRISPLSIVKALVLNICGRYNKGFLRKHGLLSKTNGYIGVVFTDRMFYENIYPLILKIKAGKAFKGRDVEVQFHPGRVRRGEKLHRTKFADWYDSDNRDREAQALKRFEKGVV
jgi:predicted glycoside hydrolase/deacetylase ChbG (UPF0249 family)